VFIVTLTCQRLYLAWVLEFQDIEEEGNFNDGLEEEVEGENMEEEEYDPEDDRRRSAARRRRKSLAVKKGKMVQLKKRRMPVAGELIRIYWCAHF
jgi:hypothetical protein